MYINPGEHSNLWLYINLYSRSMAQLLGMPLYTGDAFSHRPLQLITIATCVYWIAIAIVGVCVCVDGCICRSLFSAPALFI